MTPKNLPRKRRRSSADPSVQRVRIPSPSARNSEGVQGPRKEREGKSVPLHVHECSFVKPHVAGFNAIAATRRGTRFAISTTDGLVQLYEKFEHWQPISVVFADSGSPELAISCLKFSPCDRYLFISRLDGSVSIYFVSSEGLLPHVVLQPGGGAIWDMAFRDISTDGQFHLAIACDDGRVRFLIPDPEYPSLDPASPFPDESSHYIVKLGEKSSDRILCVSWAVSSEQDPSVACGDAAGRIRWIDANHGRSWGNARIAPVRRNPVLIWTILTVENGSVVVCGDSRGLVTLWSSRTQTMLAEIHIEGVQGAIWCSSHFRLPNRTNYVVFGCANGGVAGLTLFDDVTSWNPIRASLLHTHDVRGVAPISDQTFASASIDGQVLLFSPGSLLNKSVKVNRPELVDGVLTQSPVQFGPNSKLMVVRGKETLEFWHVPLHSKHAPSIRLRMVLRGLGPALRSFAISNDCQFVAVSSADSFRLYRVWDGVGGKGPLSLSFGKVSLISVGDVCDSAMWGCVDLAFGNGILVAISRSRTQVIIYGHEQETLRLIETSEVGCAGRFFCKIACGKNRIAVSDSGGSVYTTLVVTEENVDRNWKWGRIGEDPSSGANITCLTVSSSGERIAFAHRTGAMTLVLFKEGMMKSVSGHFSTILNSICFGEHEKGLLVSGLNHAFIVSWKVNKKPKQGRDGKLVTLKSYQVQLPGQVWSCGVLGVGHVIAARKHADIVQTYLPDAIPKKKYGA